MFRTIGLASMYSLGLLGFGGLAPVAIAQTCVALTSCGTQPIRFTPGSWVNVEVVNKTGNIINIEEPRSTQAIALSPGQTFLIGGTTKRNMSLLFWDIQGLSLQAHLQKTDYNKLLVELRWGNGLGGHDAVYLKDDGWVEVF